jgi:predicted NAD/FAD-dependent oxidoreductase
LTRRGHDVLVVEKGRSPGGRIATRRIGDARLDHGAQFFTVRSDEFGAFVQPHIDAGLVFEWCRGFTVPPDGYPRYAVREGMNALPKTIASTLDVRCGAMAFTVRQGREGSRWTMQLDDGSMMPADAVVLTCPVPQSFSLLVTAEVSLPDDFVRTDYDRTIALLATLDGAPAISEPGGVQSPTSTLSFVSDNERKGISAAPAITVHANAAWSEDHWNESSDALASQLLREAREFIASRHVVAAQIKKWRFATPRTIWPDPCLVVDDSHDSLILAGDAFAGPRIEGAVLSGLAAARALES